MDNTAELEAIIRKMLPALNLRPENFRLEPGLLDRARERGKPLVMAITGVGQVLAFVGRCEAADPDSAASQAAGRALAAMSKAAREACHHLIVSWEDAADKLFAAAFVLGEECTPEARIAWSWAPPEAWPEAMIDLTRAAPEDLLDEQIAQIRLLLASRGELPDFEPRLTRATQLAGLALRSLGAENVMPPPRLGATAPEGKWDTWLEACERAVDDELRRVRGRARRDKIGVIMPAQSGPLSGMRVFLSYARSEAAGMAARLYDALSQAGAETWFDQAQPLQKEWLDVGLADRIAACDVYLMCASDEFLERAGYATQELAWAIGHYGKGARIRRMLIVTEPATILPTVVSDWPRIEIDEENTDRLRELLVARLTMPAPTIVLPERPPVTTAERPSIEPGGELELVTLRARIRHVERMLQLTVEKVVACASSDNSGEAVAARAEFRAAGEGLDWDMTLRDFDRWPDDAMIRACRWFIASGRAVAGVRRPLSGNLDDPDPIDDDIAFLITSPTAFLAWPTVPGWGDNERRLLLRYQTGLLRLLKQLLARGLYGGLLDVPSATLDAWLDRIDSRRRQCVDALVGMRMQNLLGWQGERPAWDSLYRTWLDLLDELGRGPWIQDVPSFARLIVSAHEKEIAALAAEASWIYQEVGRLAWRLLDLPYGGSIIRVCASTSSDPAVIAEIEVGSPREQMLHLSLGQASAPAVALSWRGFGSDGDHLAAVPEALRQRFTRSSI
ncbi:toll/interleukin-1 receptor domain-containing protein [Labrys okinawensis]|uniref:toll/interleukin-1 receptor domain-containing protein n=1 Tax=Labrys okinawensis TaxID=346911 RepID=UPI0039BD833D